MKRINKILCSAAVLATALVSSCDVTDFGDINKSPNKPSTAFTEYLFS